MEKFIATAIVGKIEKPIIHQLVGWPVAARYVHSATQVVQKLFILLSTAFAQKSASITESIQK